MSCVMKKIVTMQILSNRKMDQRLYVTFKSEETLQVNLNKISIINCNLNENLSSVFFFFGF